MFRLPLIVLLALFLEACAVPKLHVQAWIDPAVSVSQYQTFAIDAAQDEEELKRLNRLLLSSFERVMTDKSFERVSSVKGADLVLRFMAKVKHGSSLQSEEIPLPGGIYTQYKMMPVNEGSLLVNLIDVKRNKVIWKGSTIRDLNNVDLNAVTQQRINERVGELMASFPKRY